MVYNTGGDNYTAALVMKNRIPVHKESLRPEAQKARGSEQETRLRVIEFKNDHVTDLD